MDRRKAIQKSGLLVGLTITGGALSTIVQSCRAEDKLSWTPEFFSPIEAREITSMIDVLLPKTETPGAIELNVEVIVDRLMAQTLIPEDQAHVKEGLKAFMNHCKEEYGDAFAKLSTEDQKKALAELAQSSNTFNPSIWGLTIGEQPPIDFFRRLKQFALIGYFSSEEIGLNHLVYDPIPGSYEGCIPADENTKVWTL